MSENHLNICLRFPRVEWNFFLYSNGGPYWKHTPVIIQYLISVGKTNIKKLIF